MVSVEHDPLRKETCCFPDKIRRDMIRTLYEMMGGVPNGPESECLGD